jgi:hypothetical protein
LRFYLQWVLEQRRPERGGAIRTKFFASKRDKLEESFPVLKKLHVKLFLIQASKAVNLITSTEVGRLSRRRGENIISSQVIQLPCLLFSVSKNH